MADGAALVELQRWFQDVVVRPDGMDEDPARLDEVVASSGGLTAAVRVALYRASSRERLLECLRTMHPALRYALGDDVFDAFAQDYLDAWPSRSYTLFLLGASFWQHLAATRPAGEAWPDFVVDLVRFEQLFLEVYDGDGPEGVAAPASLPLDGPWDGCRVRGGPGVRLFHSAFPVAAYAMAVRRGERPSLPVPGRTWLALVRRDFVVSVIPLDENSYTALEALLAGASLGSVSATVGVGPSQLRAWLTEWVGHGLVREITAVVPSERVSNFT
jgi:hypothetical protein